MDVSKMKNMVVLKNLPSNIVDEAFVVLKTNKKIKKLEKIENSKNVKGQEDGKRDKEYVLKEAEMLVADYILKLDTDKKEKQKICENKKNKKIKRWACISTFIAILEGIMLIG